MDPTFFLAQAYQLPATGQTAVVVDQGGTNTRTFNSTAAWFRTYLAKSTGTGTEADPYELIARVEGILNTSGAYWDLRMDDDGRVSIWYNGTGTGTITWGGSCHVGKLLGYAGNVGPLSTGGGVVSYLPSHCIAGTAFVNDTGWTPGPGRFSGAALPTGQVYGWGDSTPVLTRRGTLTFHPKTWSVVTSYPDVATTPMFAATSRWTAPNTSEPGQAPPWSVTDSLVTGRSRSLGVAWANFQDVIDGTATTFDRCYFDPAMVFAVKPAVADRYYSVEGLAFTFYSEDTL